MTEDTQHISKQHTKHYLIEASSQAVVPTILNNAIADVCHQSLKARGAFTIALSGGSLPGFLSGISDYFQTQGVDPQFDSWHVILADERCVPVTDGDSNMGSLLEHFLNKTSIPKEQIHGIDEMLLSESTDAIAAAYQKTLETVIEKSEGALDLAVLGFGPDGHTCSLFPGHRLLDETGKLVASIEDSPKPPPKRITLTFPVLNSLTRHVIFCGAGASKSPILQKLFTKVEKIDSMSEYPRYSLTMAKPAPFPCGMVDPRRSAETSSTVTWVVDSDAMNGVTVV